MAEDALDSEFEEGEPLGQAEELPQPEVAKIRLKVHASRDGRFRSKTIAPKRLTRDEKRLALVLVYPEDVDRPKSRADCQQMERPCPFVSCEHHLYLDVNPRKRRHQAELPASGGVGNGRDLRPRRR
jgi:hypothetical protein